MNYIEFLESVRSQIGDHLKLDPDLFGVSVIEYEDAGMKKTGLSILNKGMDQELILPLDFYYRYMGKDTEMPKILERITRDAKTTVSQIMGMDIRLDIQTCLEKIYPDICNIENNKELLKDTPYVQIHDLAVYAKIQLKDNLSVRVTENLQQKIGLDTKGLIDLAMENNRKLHPFSFQSLEEILAKENPGLYAALHESGEPMVPLYVLTTENKSHGAVYMADPECMGSIARKFDGGLYILPSSVHEVLILPKDQMWEMTPEDLCQMVREVNRTQVAPEERLADHAYLYQEGELQMLQETPEKEVERNVIVRKRPSF